MTVATRPLKVERNLPDPTRSLNRLYWTVLAAVFAGSLIFFLYTWWLSLERPRGNYTGFFGWYDQSQYLAIARDLASGHLPSREAYTYGLGYPLVAVPSLLIGFPREPFMPFNALAFGASITMVAAVGARLRSLRFGILCAGALMLASPLLALTVVPWSSTITLIAVAASLLVATSERPGWGSAIVIGIAIGACFAARYVDALFPMVIGIAGLARNPRRIIGRIALTSLVAAIFIVPVLVSHWLILGSPFTTPYASHLGLGNVGSSDQDLGSYNLLAVPGRTIGSFVSALQNHQRWPGDPLLALFPWVLAAPMGLWFLLKERHRLVTPVATAFTVSVIGTIFYMAFRASGASQLQHGLLHYFKAWFVIWGLLAAYGIARLLDRLQSGLAA